MSVVRDKSGGEGYVVIQFFEGHNHPLTTPRKVHLLRSHRDVSAAKKALSQQLAAANVAMNQQMSVLDVQFGGLENIGILERDLRNAERDRRKILEGHDANMLYEYFENEKQMNPSFMFTWEPSDDGRMIHCFWADATSRKSYEYFGDVVVFDTTYNTNRYGLIFAPMFGVNHHGQTTLLGCAFLSGEKSDAFHWFFKVWLNSMPGGPPKMIITNQDPAMAKAIATFLPNTLHRFCIWHIVNKFSEKIGALSYKEHYDDFSKCIWKSESREEFEERWVDVVKKANLCTNEWLNDMYKIRDRWIPAFVRHTFSAGMSSSQRAEISHSFYKKYVNPHNSMMNFVTRFEKALSRVRHNELDLDHKDVNERPLFRTSKSMGSKESELYTQSIFYKFQEERFQSGAYVVRRISKDEHRGLYNVKREKDSGSKGHEVSVEKSSNYVSCSCKMFECEGIPCRHMLASFTKKQFVELPNEYILRRWTKSAKACRVMDDLGGRIKEICDTPLLGRRQRLLQLACNIIDEAVVNEDDSKLLEESLLSAQKKSAGKKHAREDEIGNTPEVPISLGSQHNFKEPFPVRYKGCGKRLKGGKEKSLKKGRRCNGCGLIKQSHEKRNCPRLLNSSLQDVMLNDDSDEDEDDID